MKVCPNWVLVFTWRDVVAVTYPVFQQFISDLPAKHGRVFPLVVLDSPLHVRRCSLLQRVTKVLHSRVQSRASQSGSELRNEHSKHSRSVNPPLSAPVPWVCCLRWPRVWWSPSPGTGTGFWTRSRGRRGAVAKSRTAWSRGAPSPRSCVGCGWAKVCHLWKLLRAGLLGLDPEGWKLFSPKHKQDASDTRIHAPRDLTPDQCENNWMFNKAWTTFI